MKAEKDISSERAEKGDIGPENTYLCNVKL